MAVPLYVCQIVLLRVQPSSPAYIITGFVNTYVSVICAVFATGELTRTGLACEHSSASLVWSTGISRAAPSTHEAGPRETSSLRFRSSGVRTHSHRTDTTRSAVEITPGLICGRCDSPAGAANAISFAKQLDDVQVRVDRPQEYTV
jgi:hypothetical protein